MTFAIENNIPYTLEFVPMAVTFTLPADLTTIESEAFVGMSQGFNLVISERVTSIADDAFTDCHVVFICPDNSYAANYADTHGIPHTPQQ